MERMTLLVVTQSGSDFTVIDISIMQRAVKSASLPLPCVLDD